MPRLESLIDFMETAAGDGNESFARQIAEGHAELYRHDIANMREQSTVWKRIIVED